MKTGYLYLQTHPDHPGMVRFLTRDKMPDLDPASGSHEPAIRYVARFSDIEAAQMHVQNSLHRQLVDIDTHMYRVSLPEAMAVIESDGLKHERVWLDPSLGDRELGLMEQSARERRNKFRQSDRIWQGVGLLFVALLLLRVLGLF